MVVQSLYGLRSSGSAFRNHFVSCMEALNCLPRRADPDVWMQKVRKFNGPEYYEYMLLYVYDCLAISLTPNQCYNEINSSRFNKALLLLLIYTWEAN